MRDAGSRSLEPSDAAVCESFGVRANVLAQQGPKLQAGRERVFALLFDMNVLWERYVATLLRRVAPPGIVVATQESHLFWIPEERGHRSVRPDIVVRDQIVDGQGKTLLVIDTKWKVPPKGVPADEDLKQMFVYNEFLTGARSMLLYPATSKSFPASGIYATKQHTCEQFHLGVFDGAKWSTSAIKHELTQLLLSLMDIGDGQRTESESANEFLRR